MNVELPDEEPHDTTKTNQNNPRRRRKKKYYNKNKTQGCKKDNFKKKHSRFALTMSAWAESFTTAATWQLKHQIAYWKSRAKALEYENKILHDIIRKSCANTTDNEVKCELDTKIYSEVSTRTESEHENNDRNNDGDGDFEVSEEFIEFLRTNAKFKEDARLEREKLKAKLESENEIEQMEAGPSEEHENREEVLKELYGSKWQRIAALEMSLQSQFINESDKEKAMYWPNIPFNFNFR